MKYKLKYMQYKLKLLLKPFYIVMYYIQRAKRGFSDKDMWSADMFMARQIAGILRWYVEKGHGVPMSYAREDDFIGQDVYYMINARDAEYKKYAALFEEYGDRVSILWVYGDEAHPEEDPFASGYESKDLGWSHPYSITHTMAQRAERARFMKTDPEPDFTIRHLETIFDILEQSY